MPMLYIIIILVYYDILLTSIKFGVTKLFKNKITLFILLMLYKVILVISTTFAKYNCVEPVI